MIGVRGHGNIGVWKLAQYLSGKLAWIRNNDSTASEIDDALRQRVGTGNDDVGKGNKRGAVEQVVAVPRRCIDRRGGIHFT
ncbi:hypothetical protein WT63_23030 [Burkholderia anthina]|nr:hypothetical protein WT63_23030 [Burkholderia anthina]